MAPGLEEAYAADSVFRTRLPQEAIRDQLHRILTHPEFTATEKRRRFLSFIVEETLEGRADELKGYTIATAVFGRAPDFDPSNDPIVRIQAGKLRRELERYYLVAGGNDPVRIDIPKGRYVPFFVEQPGSDPVTATSGRGPEEPAAPVSPSVAVMPLVNLTPDSGQAYFLDGLLSELTMELGRYQELSTIPCPGIVPRSDTPADLQRLAATLGARFLLGGTLRSEDGQAKAILQLTDAATGRQVWSEAYRHGLDAGGVIARQEQIARDVVTTIAGELGIISQRLSIESRVKPVETLSTYEAILRYHHYMRVMSGETYQEAFRTLQNAVAREPEHGPAWSALGNLFNHAYIFELPGFPDPLSTAAEYAHKGALLEPRSQLTRTIMAYVHLLHGDTESAIAEARVALGLNPNSPYFVGTIGYILVYSGDFERGRKSVDRAIALNPCHPRWFHYACWLDDFRRGAYETAYREALLADPMPGWSNPAMCAASLGMLGRSAEARAYVEELRRLCPDFEVRAREHIRRTFKLQDVMERAIEGLRKAGLKIS